MLTLADSPSLATTRSPRPHAVVIGSGFGGLAAAVRLGARGYRVTVLERLEQAGGRARVHRQDGFTFDAGPTIVTAPFLFEELWTLCGRRMADDVTLAPMLPFYRIRFPDGATFDYSGDPEAMRAEVARFSPEDVDGYERFMERSAAICRVGFEDLGHVAFSSVRDMLRITPSLLRLGGHRSVYDLVARYIRDERLRTIFSFHPLLIGGSPFRASAIYCLIAHLERRWGVHFAMGGTGRLVDGLVGLIEGQGGTIRYRAEVARIDVAAGCATGVTLTDGTAIPADIVVSNADSAATYLTLLGGAGRSWHRAKLKASSSSMGLFVWYFGTNRKFPDLAHHTILMGPRYRELIADIFVRKVLAPDFSLYLHRPTATDPLLAPPGCDAFYVLSPVPNLAGGQDWSQLAAAYRQAIADSLDATVMPGLSGSIVTTRVTTPADFASDFLSFRGSGFGLEPVLTQSAWFRPHNASSAFKNLYLVGAGTHPGAGLPGVLSSAKVLDTVVPDARLYA
ncbi:phytoene desaturase [Methylobacterium sp. Leaf117]|uniref:phytoene desaturase n=1 Tax=Methylobacterium sp. Leaf117 TaxID=1736260 RepID=UPI0006F409B2|nr:phytoene desaturase [Methylobacterium sp. Leaf117]KQP96587.1 phytoene dehydrogenase [Methylobacterium sp. Leaf117]